MRRFTTLLRALRHIILAIIDFFHRPFARWIDTQTFRYLACGGSNAVLNIGLYYVSYHYLLNEKDTVTPLFTVSAPIAAFIIAFCITTPIGFFLMRTVVFEESNLRGRVQAFRYLLLVCFCLGLNYVLIRFFVNVCHFYPTVSNILTNALVAIFSYISQRVFTFQVKDEELPADV